VEILVSIVTVSLNSATTIRDTLDSVRRQRAAFGIEHICVDGGSTDGTREIISGAVNQASSLVFLFEPDRGLFDAMNKGLRLARGRYVLFLNADDFLVGSSSVADAFSHIRLTSTGPDMIMGDVVMGYTNRLGVWRMRRVPRWLPRFPRIGAHPPHQGNFISRKLLLAAGGFDADQRLAADTTQFYRLVHEFNVTMAISRSVISFMRMGGASNKEMASFREGNREAYLYLRRYHSWIGASFAVAVKVVQKVFEYRFGRLHKEVFQA
jgi:glycosyltransferase involved in cell wall biosynthesis